jgi:hypothetical protein
MEGNGRDLFWGKSTENLSQDNVPPGPDPGPAEYKAVALRIQPPRLVRIYGDLPPFPFIYPAESLRILFFLVACVILKVILCGSMSKVLGHLS